MALTMGAQAGVVTTWTAGGLGNPVTKDNLVASAGTGAKYAFRMPSNSRPGWCNFVTAPVHINDVGNDAAYTTISTEHLFTIEAGSAEGKYKLKSFKNGTYLSGNAAFDATGMDLTLTNRIPKDNGNTVGDYDTGFSEATPFVSFDNANGAHYNCGNPAGGLQFRGGTGGWSVYVTYGPFYVVNVKYLKADNTEMQAEETLIVTANTTITAPQHAGYTVDKESETITADGNITFIYTEAASFDYTLVVNNAPESTTITIKGDEVSAGSSVSFDAPVSESDVMVAFPTGYEHYSYTVTISGTTITVNCKAMTAVTDLADLTDGYYVVYGKANNAGGYFYHDKALGDRPYRLGTSTSVDLDAAQYNNETNFKYVWILKKNNDSDNSFTLRNCGTFNYFIADQNRNQNCQGSATANLVLDIANQWMYQTNYKNGDNILYLHVNQPSGDMNFSYWDGNGTPGGSGSLVAPVFYKVQLSDEAVAQIVANRKEDLSAVLTTLSSLPTGEGLNKYTVTEAGTNAITEASAVNNNEGATLEEVDAAIELLENLDDAFSLNMPKANTFLRIRSTLSDQAYLKAADAGATMTFSTTADASTIFCYIDGKLVAYNNGLAANNVCNMGVAGGAASKFTFVEGLNGTPVTYSLYESEGTITDGSVYLYSRENGGNADRGPLSQTGWYNNFTFTLEEVPSLPITLRTTDNTNYFATFSAPVPVEISGAKLNSVTKKTNSVEYTPVAEGVTQLAAGKGVLLTGTSSSATATILTETTETADYGLVGYDAAIAVSEADQATKLFLGRSSKDATKVGFFKLGSVSSNGFKAYLDNSVGGSEQSAHAVSFEGFDLVNANETTGVESIDNSQFAIDNAPVYNLQGQRVVKAQKGVFIQNGKKVVVK